MNMNDLFSLKGRVALVTGGSRGIGRMIAAGFLAQGAKVYISSRKAADCDATAKDLSVGGAQCISLPANVATLDGAKGLVDAYTAREQTLDILVNNAGAAWGEDFDTFPENGWDKVVDLNLKTPFFLTQALIGPLREAAKQQVAKVINIASIDGISVNPQETYSYAASKAGLIQLTRRMALRLAPENIAVSATTPTKWRSASRRAASAAMKTWLARRSTSRRVPATTSSARRWWSTAASRTPAAELYSSSFAAIGGVASPTVCSPAFVYHCSMCAPFQRSVTCWAWRTGSAIVLGRSAAMHSPPGSRTLRYTRPHDCASRRRRASACEGW